VGPEAIVDAVERLPDAARRVDGALEAPAAGPIPPYTLDLSGWVVGHSAPAERVEVLARGKPIFSLPVGGERRDVAAAFPDAAGAESSGYAGSLGTLRLPREFELVLAAGLADGESVPFAVVRGRRAPLPPSRAEGPQPLLLTTLGRTGSTWLSWLLGQHPDIYSYWPFGFDARAGRYWMTELQRLAEPAGSLDQLLPQGSPPSPAALFNPQLEHWLTDQNVRELADLAAGRIQALYAGMGAAPSARFFVEKHIPGQVTTELLTEVFPGTREVVLVRDFRDVLCSMRVFTARRGGKGFGRENVSGDEEHIEMLRIQAQQLLDHWRARGDDAWLVRYEELIEEPEATLRPLLGFLGVDEGAAEQTVAAATAEFTEGMSQHITAPDPASSIGRWRRDLEDPLVAQCEAAFGPIHEAFGYSS
jgi:Sulfotransferase family